jgi:hypothetical protein
LPLTNYVNCLVNDNLYALVIEGQAGADVGVLQMAWLGIQQQYADAVGDSEYSHYLTLYRDVHVLNAKYEMVKEILNLMQVHYDDRLAKIINDELSTSFVFDWNNQEEYNKTIQRCINRSKALKLRMDMVKASYEAIQSKFEQGKKPDRNYFQSILITLSDHAGYHITDQITVYEFCDRIKRLNNGRGTNKAVHRS